MECRNCHSPGPFNESYAKVYNWLCKKCASQRAQTYREADPVRLVAYRWYNLLRRRGFTQHQVAEQTRQILERCNFQSVISGETDSSKLCIAPFFRDISPLNHWNCVIVTQQEARSLSHVKNPQDALQRFPPGVCEYMAAQRAIHSF